MENAVEYNFGERGLLPSKISLRCCLASSQSASSAYTPTSYSIAVDDELIGSAEAGSVGFKLNGAELGTTYNYTITSSGGDGSVSGSGTVVATVQKRVRH